MDRLYRVEVGEEDSNNLLVFDRISYTEMKQKEIDYADELHFRVFYYCDKSDIPIKYSFRAPRVFSYKRSKINQDEPVDTTDDSIDKFNKIFVDLVNDSTNSEGDISKDKFSKFIGKGEEIEETIKLIK